MSPIDKANLDSLKTRLRGQRLLPGEPGYDNSRSVWNAMIDKRPAAIVRCLGVADVVTGVNLAREHGIPLSVKGGGHNISGPSRYSLATPVRSRKVRRPRRR